MVKSFLFNIPEVARRLVDTFSCLYKGWVRIDPASLFRDLDSEGFVTTFVPLW